MPIPTRQTWKDNTSKFMNNRTNPLIRDIDTLLEAYHNPLATLVQKHKILVLLLYYGTTWLVRKGEKRHSWRRRYVEDLIDEVETELRTDAMKTAIDARMMGVTTSNVNGRKGKQMGDHYKLELVQPRDASAKLGLNAGLNLTRGSSNIGGTEVDRFANAKDLTGHSKKVKDSLDPDHMDIVDELKVLAILSELSKIPKNLQYLTKQERANYRLELDETDNSFHLFNHITPYETSRQLNKFNKREGDLYAMDDMHMIYVAPMATGGGFHHSSFLSGKPAICAGTIILDQGQIVHITNDSGHYAPTTMDLINCVRILDLKYGVALDRMKVFDKSKDVDWPSATQFLQHNGQGTTGDKKTDNGKGFDTL